MPLTPPHQTMNREREREIHLFVSTHKRPLKILYTPCPPSFLSLKHSVISQKTHLDVLDVFKEVAAVIAHRQVKRAVEAALLLTQPTHLMVPWRTDDTR